MGGKKLEDYVIEAREVVERYKKYNRRTVEVLSSYDENLKIWYFKKVKVDQNATKFERKSRRSKK